MRHHRQSLRSLALDFLLATPPEVLLDLKLAVVLEGGQGVSGCSGHWQSGQKLNWHLGEEHSALWVCIRGLGEGDKGRSDTREGEVHSGQWTSLCSGVRVLAWSMKSFSRILDGDTSAGAELLGFLSLLAEVGDTWLWERMLDTFPNTLLLGDILFPPTTLSSTPKFSRSIFIRSR